MNSEIQTFVTHLECGLTGETYPADTVHGLSKAGRPLLVRYDLDGVKAATSKEMVAARPRDMWRFRELLPVRKAENVVSLGEIETPLIPLTGVEAAWGLSPGVLATKDEARLPTGSFKARGLAMAVSMAKAFGLTRLAMPTAGNAGAALAAYASRAGMESFVFCPDDAPVVNITETALHGAHIFRVNGLINDCGKIVGEGKEAAGWFDVSTLKEPYRIEGKKTMGLELLEQMNWQIPDVIFYPTGGGTGLVGIWKAFEELQALGWIGSERPRLVAVQPEGCAPIVKAFDDGAEFAEPGQNAKTHAGGMRVPVAVGDFLMLRAIRETNGFAVAVSEDDIHTARAEAGRHDGMNLCPEGAATLAAYRVALARGDISASDRAVLFNCGSGLKTEMPDTSTFLDKDAPIDYAAIVGGAKAG